MFGTQHIGMEPCSSTIQAQGGCFDSRRALPSSFGLDAKRRDGQKATRSNGPEGNHI